MLPIALFMALGCITDPLIQAQFLDERELTRFKNDTEAVQITTRLYDLASKPRNIDSLLNYYSMMERVITNLIRGGDLRRAAILVNVTQYCQYVNQFDIIGELASPRCEDKYNWLQICMACDCKMGKNIVETCKRIDECLYSGEEETEQSQDGQQEVEQIQRVESNDQTRRQEDTKRPELDSQAQQREKILKKESESSTYDQQQEEELGVVIQVGNQTQQRKGQAGVELGKHGQPQETVETDGQPQQQEQGLTQESESSTYNQRREGERMEISEPSRNDQKQENEQIRAELEEQLTKENKLKSKNKQMEEYQSLKSGQGSKFEPRKQVKKVESMMFEDDYSLKLRRSVDNAIETIGNLSIHQNDRLEAAAMLLKLQSMLNQADIVSIMARLKRLFTNSKQEQVAGLLEFNGFCGVLQNKNARMNIGMVNKPFIEPNYDYYRICKACPLRPTKEMDRICKRVLKFWK